MTETTKTLRELIAPHKWSGCREVYTLSEGIVNHVERTITAPLRGEIARLKEEREKVMSGEIIPGKLAVQISDLQAEIARLTARSKAADVPRSRLCDVMSGFVPTDAGKDRITEEIEAYNATAMVPDVGKGEWKNPYEGVDFSEAAKKALEREARYQQFPDASSAFERMSNDG